MRRTPKRTLVVGLAAAFAWTLSLRSHPLGAWPPPMRTRAAWATTGAPLRLVARAGQVGQASLPRSGPAALPLQFHVVADSDAPADQAAKLAVRSRLLATLASTLAGSPDEAAAMARARELAPVLTRQADMVLAALGRPYRARVVVGMRSEPAKVWGQVHLPAGTYPSLTVVLGAGRGQNWWCVVFPPLCLVNPAFAVDQNVPPSGPLFQGIPSRVRGHLRAGTGSSRPSSDQGVGGFFRAVVSFLFG